MSDTVERVRPKPSPEPDSYSDVFARPRGPEAGPLDSVLHFLGLAGRGGTVYVRRVESDGSAVVATARGECRVSAKCFGDLRERVERSGWKMEGVRFATDR